MPKLIGVVKNAGQVGHRLPPGATTNASYRIREVQDCEQIGDQISASRKRKRASASDSSSPLVLPSSSSASSLASSSSSSSASGFQISKASDVRHIGDNYSEPGLPPSQTMYSVSLVENVTHIGDEVGDAKVPDEPCTVRVGTWNVRGKSGKFLGNRNQNNFFEVARHHIENEFDVIALIECGLKDELCPPGWQSVTYHKFVLLYRRSIVQLVKSLPIPKRDTLFHGALGGVFVSGRLAFTVVGFHLKQKDPVPERKYLVELHKEFSAKFPNVIFLGDFNTPHNDFPPDFIPLLPQHTASSAASENTWMNILTSKSPRDNNAYRFKSFDPEYPCRVLPRQTDQSDHLSAVCHFERKEVQPAGTEEYMLCFTERSLFSFLLPGCRQVPSSESKTSSRVGA